MNLRQYLISMSIGTLVAMSSWCVVLMAMNPLIAGGLAHTAFYFTLGLWLAGSFTIFGTGVRAYRFPNLDVGATVNRSLRQAVLLALLLVGSLYLMTLGLFSTLTLLLAVLAAVFLEFFFLISAHERVKDINYD